MFVHDVREVTVFWLFSSPLIELKTELIKNLHNIKKRKRELTYKS